MTMTILIADDLKYGSQTHTVGGLGTSKLLVPLFAALRLNTVIYSPPPIAGEIER